MSVAHRMLHRMAVHLMAVLLTVHRIQAAVTDHLMRTMTKAVMKNEQKLDCDYLMSTNRFSSNKSFEIGNVKLFLDFCFYAEKEVIFVEKTEKIVVVREIVR